MKLSSTSHLAIRNRVGASKTHLNSRGRRVTTTALVSAHSAIKRSHQNQIHETTFAGVPTTLLTSTSSFRARIEAGSITKIQGGTLRFNITNSSNSRLVSPVWWFDRIVVFGSGGSKELTTIYDVNLFHGLQNMGKDCRRAAGLNDTWCSQDLLVAAGESKDFYLPIPSHFLSEIYTQELKSGDIVLHLHPHGDVVASGSGVVTVNT